MRAGTELAGKVALVTGAARNIGRAISHSLAAGGASVMVNARTSRAEAEKTVEMIGSKGAFHIADVTKPDEVKALVEATVKRFGRLDFLVNNAAVRYETAFSSMSYQEWQNRARDRARRRVPVRAGGAAAHDQGRRRLDSEHRRPDRRTRAPPSARTWSRPRPVSPA